MKTKNNILLPLVATIALFSSFTQAASVTLNPTADGDVQTWGGDDVDTTDMVLSFTQSGGLARNAILEFDLSSIPDSATINSATFSMVLSRFVSNTGSNPAAIDIFAYSGDGIVDISDYAAAGTQVFDGTTPHGGSNGDIRSFNFSNISPISSLLSGNLLSLRLETDSFASIQIGALESTSIGSGTLTIDYTAVPIPAAAWLFVSGLAGLGITRKVKTSS